MDYEPEQASADLTAIEADMWRRLDATLDMTAPFDEDFIDPLGLGTRARRDRSGEQAGLGEMGRGAPHPRLATVPDRSRLARARQPLLP